MHPRNPSTTILALGGVMAVFGVFYPRPPLSTETWLAVAGAYLLTGILFEVSRYVRGTGYPTFGYSLAVALVSMVFTIGVRAWAVLSARPELAVDDLSFILWQFYVIMPIIIVSMGPLGVATSHRNQIIALIIIFLPFLAAVMRAIQVGSVFGRAFAIMYYSLVLLTGIVSGLPLYWYGRRIRKQSISRSSRLLT